MILENKAKTSKIRSEAIDTALLVFDYRENGHHRGCPAIIFNLNSGVRATMICETAQEAKEIMELWRE